MKPQAHYCCFSFVFFCCLLSVFAIQFPTLSKLKDGIEARLKDSGIIDTKLTRAVLSNNFESGSANPWYDESPGFVNWRVEDFASPTEEISPTPRPPTGTKYMRATRNTDLSSGLAVLRSPLFTANPGDRVSFDFWIRSKRSQSNDLELVWMVNPGNEHLLIKLTEYSTLGNYEWRGTESVAIPIDVPTEGALIFYGYCGSNVEDAIAIDNIVFDPSNYTAPQPTTEEPSTSCACGGVFDESSGVIQSPNFPNNYCPDLNCRYNINVPSGSKVRMEFTNFETEPTYDVVTVYDGPDTSFPVLLRESGALTLLPLTISSSSNECMVRFTSDGSIDASGWRATYAIANN